MLFNSVVFFQFFAAFLLLYWLVRHHLPARNVLIVTASYVFYGWWNWKLLSLLILSTIMDYGLGLAIHSSRNHRTRKIWIWVSVVTNLSLLGVFKYYDFFVTSLASLLTQWGIPFHPATLHVILPVGISFYTFQSMSYVIDVYRHQISPAKNLVAFMAYVSFFPQLVAGPIERAHHLLPQFLQPRIITRTMVEEGLWLCLWGLFKKVVVADHLSPLVSMVYHPEASVSGPAVLLATAAFGIQIYGDFSGYSDMARGLARLLGFDIMVNFNLPYFATNLREFWHRWHISLSTWLRDYLYISLGGNRSGPGRTAWNLWLTMLLGGIWHGASWHFLIWGCYHGTGLVLHRLAARRLTSGRAPKSNVARSLAGWLITLLFVFYGWLLFRAESWPHVVTLTQAFADWTMPAWFPEALLLMTWFVMPMLLVEIWQFYSNNALVVLSLPPPAKGAVHAILILALLLFWNQAENPFIYFQF